MASSCGHVLPNQSTLLVSDVPCAQHCYLCHVGEQALLMTTNSTFDRNLWTRVPSVEIFVEAVGTLMSSAVPVVDAAAIITSCVGVFLLACRRHFWRPMCYTLSMAYWCSALWIAWTCSAVVGVGLGVAAVAIRRSLLLFPEWTPATTGTNPNPNLQSVCASF